MNKDTEKDMVLSINASAEFLGMSRSTFWRKAKEPLYKRWATSYN